MINWQFFSMAGLVSGVLFLIAFVLWAITESYFTISWRCGDILTLIAKIILIVIVIFWLIIGIISCLNFIWSWGLIV